jgi:ribosomal protein L11 methyltransferase
LKLIDYLAVTFECPEESRDMLVAELSYMGYDSMMETESGIEAYIEENEFDKQAIDTLIDQYSAFNISYSTSRIVSRNWNEEWEKNYEPIDVEGRCRVRAIFHEPDESYPLEILINPRMSFGTGHHSTTFLMIRHMLDLDNRDKRVLDAGCGTAILAVLAEKLGAKEVIAYDNNSWAVENAPENVGLNNCSRIKVLEGTIDTLGLTGKFDIILANINKNVLLDEMDDYASYLKPGGVLMLSGFYDYDEEDITGRVLPLGFELIKTGHRNRWSSLLFKKK